MHSFIFLRHGRSLADDEGKHEGRYDSPLTEVGREQARRTALELAGAGIEAIVASPLARASETARIVNEVLKVGLEESPLLMERDNGVLAGLSFEEARARYPEPPVVSLSRKFPENSGENGLELNARALLCLAHLLAKPSGRYLVVSHGTFLNCLVKKILDMPLEGSAGFRLRDNGFIELDYYEERRAWVFKRMSPGYA